MSEEEHKAFFSSNVLDQCFRNLYKYKIMKKYFHNILNENINILNERFNTAVLNLLMTTVSVYLYLKSKKEENKNKVKRR